MDRTYGTEAYPRYYWLWHLIALGVLEAEPPAEPEGCPTITGAIWDDPALENGREVTVALIDMGVASGHPNLDPPEGSAERSRVDRRRALDLATHRYGATYAPLESFGQTHLEERVRHLEALAGSAGILGPLPADEQAILDRLIAGIGVRRSVRAYERHFSGHGTACAGLVCGTTFETGRPAGPSAYFGVAPFARILPITTSISPDPAQLTAAFLYAHAMGADAVLFPRDAADPQTWPHYDRLDPNERTRLDDPAEAGAGWRLFARAATAVSRDIPVICAAGNAGRSRPIYPAGLAGASDENGIVAVGAVGYAGRRSGYSNYGPGLTVAAPSDDGELYTRHQIRLDREAPEILDFWLDGVHPGVAEIAYSAERLIAPDVPGPHGYAAGARRGPVGGREEAADDPGGLYTVFGGTSGAASLVAGLAALAQRAGPERLAGPAVKRLLKDAAGYSLADWYWLPDGDRTLKADTPNGEAAPNDARSFGHGLVDARRLLALRTGAA